MQKKQAHFRDKNAATIAALSDVSAAAIKYLDSIETTENRNEVAALRRTYTARSKFTGGQNTLESEQLQNLFIQAFQFEHSYVQQQLARQNIPQELANQLNEQISTDELVYMQSMT